MADLSGLGALQKRSNTKPSKPEVKWRARYFGADKKIHIATVSTIYKEGFTLLTNDNVPLGASLNIEFVVMYRDEVTKLRFKGEVTYSLLPSGGGATQLEIKVTQITKEHQHIVNNLLQLMMNNPSTNLRV